MLKAFQRLLLVTGLLLIGSAGVGLARYHLPQQSALTKLEIPRLGLSVSVLEGDDEATLAKGAGHIKGTAPIGSLGNAAVAGHRDTIFRPLRMVRIGDRIHTIAQDHSRDYVVESIRIVDPSDTRLLQLGTTPTLTLVTCYPFNYVGSAPKRFVVQARLMF